MTKRINLLHKRARKVSGEQTLWLCFTTVSIMVEFVLEFRYKMFWYTTTLFHEPQILVQSHQSLERAFLYESYAPSQKTVSLTGFQPPQKRWQGGPSPFSVGNIPCQLTFIHRLSSARQTDTASSFRAVWAPTHTGSVF